MEQQYQLDECFELIVNVTYRKEIIEMMQNQYRELTGKFISIEQVESYFNDLEMEAN